MICSRRARAIGGVLIVLGCLLIQLPVASAQPAPASESHRWGINNDHMATGVLPDESGQLPEGDLLLRARAAGIGWVRYVLFWHVVNPNPGLPRADQERNDWWVADVEIARLRAAGFNILVHVAYPPTWTTGATYGNEFAAFYCLDETPGGDGVKPGPPGSEIHFNCRDSERRPGFGLPPDKRSQHFREFVAQAVRRYHGQVQAWGFGMEFHNQVYWKGTAEQLFDEVLRPGYEEVKAVDAGLLVVGPEEDVEDFFEVMLRIEQQRGTRAFDVLSFHAFAHSEWAKPGQVDVEWRGGDRGIDCTFEKPGEKLCSFRQISERYAQGRPVWLTEFGYRAGSSGDPAAGQWLTDWVEGIKARPWIDKAFFYRLRQDPDGRGFGLFAEEPAAVPSPAAAAAATGLATQPLPLSSYLAEGSTAGLFDLDVLVANPTSQPAPVKLTFLSDGGKVETLTDTLPATSRRTYGIGRTHLPTLSSAGGVSTVVESTLGVPLVVERTMFWNKAQKYAGHGGTAVAQPEKRWYFAEGSQGFFDTFVLLANAGNTKANVTLTFLLDGGDVEPVVVQREVAAQTRVTFWAIEDDRLINRSFAIVVEADVPIMAERAMYFGQRFVWPGGHESAGVPTLSTRWFHAEGATGPTFDEYILVGNPSDVATQLTVTFLLRDGGPPIVGTANLAAKTRFTLNVEYAGLFLTGISEDDAQRLLAAEVSVQVESTEPVVSERAMYWPGGPSQWTEAHNSFGATETGTKWGLAEGRIGGSLGYATYILVANPSSQDATVRVTFLKPDGTTGTPIEKVVAANSRANVDPGDMPPPALGAAVESTFGAILESTNGVPIVVERAMYWTPVGGPWWGGGTNATAVRLP